MSQKSLLDFINSIIAAAARGNSAEEIVLEMTTPDAKPFRGRSKKTPTAPEPESPTGIVEEDFGGAGSPVQPPIRTHAKITAPLPNSVSDIAAPRTSRAKPPPVPTTEDEDATAAVSACDQSIKPTPAKRGRSAAPTGEPKVVPKRASRSKGPSARSDDTASHATVEEAFLSLAEAIELCRNHASEPVTRCMRKLTAGAHAGNVCGKTGANVETAHEAHEVRCGKCSLLKGGTRTSIAKDVELPKPEKKAPAVKPPQEEDEPIRAPSPVASDRSGIPPVTGAPMLNEHVEEEDDEPPVKVKAVKKPPPPEADDEADEIRRERIADTPPPIHGSQSVSDTITPLGLGGLYISREKSDEGIVVIASMTVPKKTPNQPYIVLEGTIDADLVDDEVRRANACGIGGAKARFMASVTKIDTETFDSLSETDIVACVANRIGTTFVRSSEGKVVDISPPDENT
jgi:hypothetical protein